MKPDSWKRVAALLEAALERPSDARTAFLDEACSGHDALREKVEKLLANHEEAEENRFLAQAPASLLAKQKSTEITPGARFGSYEITSLLGVGGMGEVYRAKDLELGRDVAIKVLRKELASEPEGLKRFEREARTASALNHPNITTIYHIGEHEGTRYIVMEYVEGKTLRELLGEGPLPSKTLLRLATQIAEGLDKAHSARIVHRDLKPENLMVTGDGLVKILDFGLAKLTGPPVKLNSDMDTVTKVGTRQGTILGTVQYMSPEQASGRAVDYRSDQFSLGLILYEMATGKVAFQRDTAAATLAAIIEGKLETDDATRTEPCGEFPTDGGAVSGEGAGRSLRLDG